MRRLGAARTLTRLGPAVLALLPVMPELARADPVVADLSSHLIAITSGFTGASVVLFGATDGPGNVIAVIRGPERPMTVWRKGKVSGIWVNREAVTFLDVPSFYAVMASRPLDEAVLPEVAARNGIGIANLTFEAEPQVKPERVRLFTEALLRRQQRAGLFRAAVGKISFLGAQLFRATIAFPENVPTGNYRIDVFLVRNRDIVGGQTVPLVVSKGGVDAAVFDFATRDPATYGAIAVLTAVVAGWLASLPFRGV